jgi:hypothetical protein
MVLSANIICDGRCGPWSFFVENPPMPFDRRAWAISPTLKQQAEERGPQGVWVVRSVPDFGQPHDRWKIKPFLASLAATIRSRLRGKLVGRSVSPAIRA